MKLRASKVLVTGGSGFIGVHLIKRLLLEAAVSVVNLDKLTYSSSSVSIRETERYTFEQIDLCDASQLRRVFENHQPDSVIHLAAESHVDRSIAGPDVFIQTNIVGTYNLLQASLKYWEKRLNRSKDFRFLHASTDEVYGALSEGDAAFDEMASYDPRSPYAASKAAGDHLVRAWASTYELPVLVTHCSNNFGPYQHEEKLIPLVIKNCLEGKPIPIYGTGDNIRDWIYVQDHVEALYAVLTEGSGGETYNIGANNEMRNIELIQMICSILDDLVPISKRDWQAFSLEAQKKPIARYKDLIAFVEDRAGHDYRYAINATKIQEELDWRPTHDFRSMLRQTIEWYISEE